MLDPCTSSRNQPSAVLTLVTETKSINQYSIKSINQYSIMGKCEKFSVQFCVMRYSPFALEQCLLM